MSSSSGGVPATVKSFIGRHQRIGIDSNILIALVELESIHPGKVASLFEAIDRSRKQVWSSAMTITEVLLKPQLSRDDQLVSRYEQALFAGNFIFAPITQATARQAAILGSRYHFRAADALILSSLIEQNVTGFVTADAYFQRVKDLEVLVLRGSS